MLRGKRRHDVGVLISLLLGFPKLHVKTARRWLIYTSFSRQRLAQTKSGFAGQSSAVRIDGPFHRVKAHRVSAPGFTGETSSAPENAAKYVHNSLQERVSFGGLGSFRTNNRWLNKTLLVLLFHAPALRL